MQKLLHPISRAARQGLLAAAAAVLLCAAGALAQPPAAPAAAEPARELLNSERIEQRFGSYGIEVLESGPVRVSNLYSSEAGMRVCRTFAIVRYPRHVSDALAAEHEAILRGGSIGAVFAASGWRVTKRHLYYGEVESTPRVQALMGGLTPSKLAVHVYVFQVERGGAAHDYAVIAEVHHPGYLTSADLPRIYGAPSAAAGEALTSEMLLLVADKMR